MKNYEEMSNDVFRRIDEYNLKKQRQKKTATRILVPTLCVCLTFLIGLGLTQSGFFSKAPVQASKKDTSVVSTANRKPTDKDSSVIQMSAKIDVTAHVPAKKTAALKTKTGLFEMMSPYKNDKEKFEAENSVVIYGKVVSANYVLDGSTVFTKSEVKILKCYKGNFKSGDTIFVKEYGGFVPSDILNNAISIEKFGKSAQKQDGKSELLDIRLEDFKVMEQGEEVILFLVPIAETDVKEFENCYELLRAWQGKLLFDKKYNAFIPYCPSWDLAKNNKANDEASVKIKSVGTNENGAQVRAYTLEEFEAFAKQCK